MAKRKNKIHTRWYIRSLDKIILLFILGLMILVLPGQNVYMYEHLQKSQSPDSMSIDEIPIPKPAPLPIKTDISVPDDTISATGIVIRDVASGTYLYKKNEQFTLSPASTTKLMTAIISLEQYRLDDILTVSRVETEGQTMGLVTGERITVENLLYGALIHSGNDAAYTLAEQYPGGYTEFIKKMNEKASDLGLAHSSFTNPVGFDDPNHQMTAEDLMILSTYAIKNQIIARMVAIPEITVSDITFTYFHKLKNVNQLLGKIPGVGGIKTGWTEAAGQNLVTLVERNGHKVILVVLHSQDRFSDTEKLINWVFTHYTWQEFGLPTPSQPMQ